jgi:hypothetical protein
MIDLAIVYRILVRTARRGALMTYEEMSDAYEAETGEWHHPHGTWDHPFGTINTVLCRLGLAALTAVVTKKNPRRVGLQPEPGGEFWGCCPCVPAAPSDDDERIEEWSRILRHVYAENWPEEFPGQ